MEDNLRFTPMTSSPQDLQIYADDVCKGMSADDVHPPQELAERLNNNRVKCWWVYAGDDLAGWCALAPHHNKYTGNDWHLYGGWVRPAFRGRGVFRRMWVFRMALVPQDACISVSVQPDKDATLKMAKEHGFVYHGAKQPWDIYILKR